MSSRQVDAPSLSEDGPNVQRQAFAGSCGPNSSITYAQRDWLAGDPAQPTPPEQRSMAATATGLTFTMPM